MGVEIEPDRTSCTDTAKSSIVRLEGEKKRKKYGTALLIQNLLLSPVPFLLIISSSVARFLRGLFLRRRERPEHKNIYELSLWGNWQRNVRCEMMKQTNSKPSRRSPLLLFVIRFVHFRQISLISSEMYALEKFHIIVTKAVKTLFHRLFFFLEGKWQTHPEVF